MRKGNKFYINNVERENVINTPLSIFYFYNFANLTFRRFLSHPNLIEMENAEWQKKKYFIQENGSGIFNEIQTHTPLFVGW